MMLRENKVYIERIIPYDKAGVIQVIRKQGELVSEEHVADGIQIKAYDADGGVRQARLGCCFAISL